MPNYTIIANNTFKNRTFDDLIRPLAMYTDVYNAQEETLNELATKASIWENMANEETDPIAYAQYKRYADELGSQAEMLAANGLNPFTRKAVLDLRRRYASEIAPIEQAYANRKAQADEQRKALLQNPTLLLSRRADATSLDKYLANPQLGYENYSGALLTSQVATAAASLAKELRSYGKGKKLDAFTNTWLKQHGFTAAEVTFAINHPNDPRSSNVLNTLVNNVVADSGIPQWADRATLGQAYNYARQGLYSAIGQTDVEKYEDYGARLAAQEASQKRVAAYQHALANPQPTTNHALLRPTALFSQRERDSLAKELNYALSKGWIVEKNGRYSVTKAGLKKYNEKPPSRPANIVMSQETLPYYVIEKHSNPFRDFLIRLNGGKPLNNDKVTFMPNHASNLLTMAARRAYNGDYDAERRTEWLVDLDKGQAEGVIGNAILHSSNGKLRAMDFDTKKNAFVPTKESYTADELLKMTNIQLRPSKYGVTLMGILDGKPVRVEVPHGVGGTGTLQDLISNIGTRTDAANIMHSLSQKKKPTQQDIEDYMEAENAYYEAGDIANQYISNLFVPTKTEEVKITAVGR